jgi:hypothetical protein
LILAPPAVQRATQHGLRRRPAPWARSGSKPVSRTASGRYGSSRTRSRSFGRLSGPPSNGADADSGRGWWSAGSSEGTHRRRAGVVGRWSGSGWRHEGVNEATT